jgi:hypothetical protein
MVCSAEQFDDAVVDACIARRQGGEGFRRRRCLLAHAVTSTKCNALVIVLRRLGTRSATSCVGSSLVWALRCRVLASRANYRTEVARQKEPQPVGWGSTRNQRVQLQLVVGQYGEVVGGALATDHKDVIRGRFRFLQDDGFVVTGFDRLEIGIAAIGGR